MLTDYTRNEISSDDIVAAVNSREMIGEDEGAASAFARGLAASETYEPRESENEEVPTAHTFQEHLACFADMKKEQRLTFGFYLNVYETAQTRIAEFTVRISADPGSIQKIFNVWLFAPAHKVPFSQNSTTL
jgi:hypothetical protein